MNLSELERMPSFALLGPGWSGASTTEGWTLLSDLQEHTGPDGLVLLGFEDAADAARTWRAGSECSVQPVLDVPQSVVNASISREGYDASVCAIQEAIRAGDVYQVCLTRQAALPSASGAALLRQLCARGVPAYAAWVRLPDGTELVSGSPELFFRVADGIVHTMPMKGTAAPEREAELDSSEKDCAELAMITDLLRNDLRAVCEPKTVCVQNARMKVRLSYAVQTVSHITGTLAASNGPRDVLQALHPGGSITGAPKLAAIEKIRLLEPGPRGLYTGALGLVRGPHAVFSLLIRTAVKARDGWHYGVGGGVTIDSVPRDEWAEMLVKLSAVARVEHGQATL